MSVYDDRQKIKVEDAAYRDAARRLTAHLGGSISDYTAVQRPAGNDGAFISVTIWIPRAEIEPKCEHDPYQCDGKCLEKVVDAAVEVINGPKVVCPRCKSADRLRAFPGGKHECVECDFVF